MSWITRQREYAAEKGIYSYYLMYYNSKEGV